MTIIKGVPGVTLADIRAAIDLMKKQNIPPRVVADEGQAAEFTRASPTGRVWALGDEYYEMRHAGGRMAIEP